MEARALALHGRPFTPLFELGQTVSVQSVVQSRIVISLKSAYQLKLKP